MFNYGFDSQTKHLEDQNGAWAVPMNQNDWVSFFIDIVVDKSQYTTEMPGTCEANGMSTLKD